MEGIETLGVENFENFLKKFAPDIGAESQFANRLEIVYLYMKWTKKVEFTQRDFISWVEDNMDADWFRLHKGHIADWSVESYVKTYIGIFFRNGLLVKKHPDLYTVTDLH
jgi:hypothetical protein